MSNDTATAVALLDRLNAREIPKFEMLGPGDIVW